MYVAGLDPASQNDFFGIVIHQVVDKMPKLCSLRKLRHLDFSQMLKILEDEIFRKYPPSKIVVDYTNEKSLTDRLVDRYGKRDVVPLNFTLDTKKMLKDDGLSVLKQGYKFPNPHLIKNPQIRQWVLELIEELKHEELRLTRSGKETFDHPTGKHNDLAVAWELSIHGCLEYMFHGEPSHVCGPITRTRRRPLSDILEPSYYRNFKHYL